jgi:choline dehydrogenase-like flavoprotein
MILDIRRLSADSVLEADVCIIGSGAAGISLATEFLDTPFRVMVLESGGLQHDPDTQNLYNAEIAGNPFVGALDGRARVYGGTTTRWGGQSLRLQPLDFERRPWIAHSGWPYPLRGAGTVLRSSRRKIAYSLWLVRGGVASFRTLEALRHWRARS